MQNQRRNAIFVYHKSYYCSWTWNLQICNGYQAIWGRSGDNSRWNAPLSLLTRMVRYTCIFHWNCLPVTLCQHLIFMCICSTGFIYCCKPNQTNNQSIYHKYIKSSINKYLYPELKHSSHNRLIQYCNRFSCNKLCGSEISLSDECKSCNSWKK